MAKTSQVPVFVRVGNMLTTTLLRAGFNMGVMYLLTVRGRKSGLPRTTPIAVVDQDGKRYLASPYGVVDWIRNLRAAREAVLSRGSYSETVRAIELSPREGALVLKKLIKGSSPFDKYFNVTAESSLEDFEHAAVLHPVFLLQKA